MGYSLGTIRTLIDVAFTRSDQCFEEFTEHFLPEARTVCHYQATLLWFRLSKYILIRTLTAAAIRALNDVNSHECNVSASQYKEDRA